MSDDDKSKKGFASNPDGINRRGRPVGSKNKLPTDPQLKELLKKNAPEAVQTLIRLMRDGNKEETKLKASIKIIDMTYSIVLNDEKLGSTDKPQAEKPNEDSKPTMAKVISMTVKSI